MIQHKVKGSDESVSFFGGGIAFPIVLVVVGIAILANLFFRND